MSSTIKTHEVTRCGIAQVHEHCPQRAYAELAVPLDSREVTAASFTTVSRDQGWADNKQTTYTWFEVGLRRSGAKRSNLGAVGIQHNRVGNPEFFRATTHWDRQHPQLRSTVWLQSLRPGDVIQIVPKAVYPGWVNIVQEATIKIEYRQVDDAGNSQQRQSATIPASYYKPLDHASQQIRLLVVKPGNHEDAIQVRFAYASLGELSGQQSDFDALSYCWGDSPEYADIAFETENNTIESVGISRIVEGAIRRLRNPDRPLRIWIDAICINQADNQERSQQVSFMGVIYSAARVVHIWLYEDYAGIEAALRVVRDIYNYKWRVCSGGDRCACPGTKHTLRAEDLDAIRDNEEPSSYAFLQNVTRRHADGTHLFDSYAVEAAGGPGNIQISHLMQSLFQHPWFQRVWVVQEAAGSRHGAIVYYGKEEIHWKELLFVNELLGSPYFDGQSPHTRGLLTMPDIWNMLADAEGERLDATGQSPGQSQRQIQGQTQGDKTRAIISANGRDPATILQVFLAALDMKASDSRDKLFALLSFGQETRTMIPSALRPDYTKALPNVMADFTRWWIRQYRSLDILSFIHCQPTRSWQRTLSDDDPRTKLPIPRPTWAVSTEGYPRWARMTLVTQFPFFRASADTVPCEDPEPEFDSEQDKQQPLILRLRGFKLGSIVAVGDPPRSMVHPYTRETPPSQQTDADLPTVFHLMFDPSGYTGMWSHPSTTKKVDQMGPAVRNRIFDDHVTAHAAYFPTTAARLAIRPTGKRDEPGLYHRFSQRGELPTCIDRCFFVLSNGFYGLCPWTVQEGDEIALLHGGKVPYVIRQVQTSGQEGKEEKGATRYELVGECFVDRIDVMGGAFMKSIMTSGKSQVFELV